MKIAVLVSILLSLTLNVYAEIDLSERIKTFEKEWITHYSSYSKGYKDINIDGRVSFETKLNLNTGMLFAIPDKSVNVSFPILDVKAPDHLKDAELILALKTYDTKSRETTGYFFLAYVSSWSNLGPKDRGTCGQGTEDEMAFFYVDRNGNLKSERRFLVMSCRENIGNLFVRSNTPENKIYINYINNDGMNVIYFKYLRPEKGYFKFGSPIVFEVPAF